MWVKKQVVQIAHCIYLVLDHENNANNSKSNTHYHRYNTANSKHRKLNHNKGKKKYFDHDKTNHD